MPQPPLFPPQAGDRVEAGLLAHMREQGLSTIAVNAAAVAGFHVIAHATGPAWLPAWTAAGLGVALLRLLGHAWMVQAIRRRGDAVGDSTRWLWVYGLGLAASSLLWAFLCLFAYDGLAPEDRGALLLVVSALAGGATGVLAPLRRMGPLYIASLLLAGSSALLLATPSEPVMAALGIAFMVVMLLAHARNHRSLVDGLRLSLENLQLVGELSRQNQLLEERVAERTRALQAQAHRDALTGLTNRHGLPEIDIPGVPGTVVVFIDLDRFKDINDTRGHLAGDAVLRHAAARLRAAPPDGAQLLRWGGDEFVAVLPGIGDAAALAWAHRTLEALAQPMLVGEVGDVVLASASIGLAWAPDHGRTIAELIGAADFAAMQAKRDGRARLLAYTPELGATWARRKRLEGALARATDDASLALHYQPIAGRSGQARQLEALLRWRPAGEGPVGPAEFIPIAEDSGAILAIGEWVLERACRDARTWQARHPGLAVAVNVSVVQLRLDDFPATVARALAQSGLAPSLLVLEVTESAFTATTDEQVLRRLEAIAATGVRLEVDDFGTGFSSLSRLHLFPLSAIKIDRFFVQRLDASTRGIIEGVRLIAERFALDVIAEGVEDEATASALWALGADALQGYHIGRPLPLDDALAALGGAAPAVARTG